MDTRSMACGGVSWEVVHMGGLAAAERAQEPKRFTALPGGVRVPRQAPDQG